MTNQEKKFDILVLAGGASSRFFPFNSKGKTVFRLMGKPLVWYTLNSLSGLGIASATVVRPKENAELENATGAKVGQLKVHYMSQEKPKGQADAILTAWKSIKNSNPLLILNFQHFTAASIISKVMDLFNSGGKSVVVSTKTDAPWKYGIISVEGVRVTSVVEKPKKWSEPSNLRIVGIYLLTPEAIKIIASRPENEYQLEDGLNELASQGKLAHLRIDQPLASIKYPWDLFSVKDILLGDKQYIDKSAFVHKTAVIEGPCWIGPNAVVGAFCLLRKGVILEEGAQAERYLEVKNSIIGENSHVHSGFVGDSVIGENCRIGAGFITANRRFDRRNILVEVKGKKVDTGMSSLGVFVGDNANIGIHCGTMPGTVLGPDSIIWPGRIITGTVPAKTIISDKLGKKYVF